MKSKLFILVTALLFPAVCFAGNISNPASESKHNSLALEYNFESNRFKPEADTLGNAPNNVQFSKITVNMDQVYLRGSIKTFSETGELFFKLGLADFKGQKMFDNGSDFKDGYKFSGSFGIKQSFKLTEKIRAGAVFQYTYFSNYEEELSYTAANGSPARERIKIKNPREADLALAVSYGGKGFSPYVGPMVSVNRFSIDSTITYPNMWIKVKNNYKKSDLLGGLAGIDFFNEKYKINVEAQIFRRPSASVTLSYLF